LDLPFGSTGGCYCSLLGPNAEGGRICSSFSNLFGVLDLFKLDTGGG